MKKLISNIIVLSLTFNLIVIIFSMGPTESKFIDGLGNPNDNEGRIITIEGEGAELLDGTTYFEFPLGQGSVMDAEFNISVMEHGSNYPINPIIDVGLDNDIDWQFSGTGYGAMGYQQNFTDGTTKHTASFTNPSGGTDLSTTVKLPKDAKVKSADISLHGRFSQPDFQTYRYNSDLGLPGVVFVAMGDINNDAWPDAVVTSESQGMVVWYENDGTPMDSEWSNHEITNKLSRAWAVDVGDMDNDGDLDVVATSSDSNTKYGIYWYENVNTTNDNYPGNGSSWSEHRIDSKINYTYYPRSLQIADLDNDGDNDTVVGSYDYLRGGVYWFENVHGNGTTWTNYTIYHESGKDNTVTDIDVKNINYSAPGRLDVAAALNGQQLAIWLENNGDPANIIGDWPKHTVYSRPYTYCVVIHDMNGDNKNDIVVGHQRSYGIYWYKAPSDLKNATQWSSSYYVSWIWYLADMDIANINNDNYPDIVATSDSWDYIYFYRNNNAAGTSFSTYQIEYNFRGPTGIAIENVDKDSNGKDIIVCGRYSSEVRWYQNGGGSNPQWEVGSIEEITLFGPQGMFCADIDKDGNEDMVVTGNRGGDVVWLEAPDDPTNSSNEWLVHVIDNNFGAVLEVFVDDIDGDGWLDVAVTAQYPMNKVVWYKCPANPALEFGQWTLTEIDTYLYYAWGIHIADIDDDGDNDVVATGRYADKLYWYRNNDVTTPGTGDGLSWSKYTIDSNLNEATGVWVADMDNDNDLDVVASGASWSSGTGVAWYEAPPDPTSSWIKHTIDTSPRYVYDVHVADIDHDGHNDVIIAPYYDNFLRWYESPDNPKTGVWVGHDIWRGSSYYLYAYNLWVDDIGNDGYYDIVVGTNYQNNIWWFEAPDEPAKAGLWTRYVVDPGISEPRGVFISDIDSDGIKDIQAASYGLNQVNWYKVNIEYPQNVKLEIGSNNIFTKNGELNINVQHTTDFAAIVNTFLSDNKDNYDIDEYGNEFINLKIAIKSDTEGRITVEDLDIIYDWTTKVDKKPDGFNLALEITDLIPQAKNGTHRIYVGFKSDTPCKVRISDLSLEYNGAPDISEIEDRSIMEDTMVEDLYYLPNYFNDDYLQPEQLYYGIKYWTNTDYVNMRIYDRYFLYVDCNQTPNTNWNGESEVVVYASDHETIYTYSNPFTVKVLPVDDTPVVKNKIPNIKILMNHTNYDIDLDRVNRPYFTDIDSEKLYYFIDVDEKFKDNITLNLSTEKILEITAISGPVTGINITVYCDDNPIKQQNIDNIKAFQTFQVEVLEIIDETELSKPRWKKIQDCKIIEDKPGVNNWIYLPNYVDDYDDDSKKLEYTIVAISNNGWLEVIIDDDNNIDIIPLSNFDGISEVLLKARDDDGNIGYGTFNIIMKPVNDPPIIEYRIPTRDSVVSGEVLIGGFSEDIEGSDITVQIKFGPNTLKNPWLDVTNITNTEWFYNFDTLNYNERTNVLVTVRAFDGELYSDNVSMTIIVDNTLKDSDGDGYSDGIDAFPFDEKEWYDSDNDGVGNNRDTFPEEPTQWSDIDEDGYGDNPKGKGYDQFPYDPTQFKDKDGDGYGDNIEGNNPDYYPYENKYHAKGSMDADEQQNVLNNISGSPLLPYFIMVIILVIINIYLFSYLYMTKTGKLESRRAAKEAKRKAKLDKEAKQKLEGQKDSKIGKKDTAPQGTDPGAKTMLKSNKISMKPIVYYPGESDIGVSGPTKGTIPGPIPAPMPVFMGPMGMTSTPMNQSIPHVPPFGFPPQTQGSYQPRGFLPQYPIFPNPYNVPGSAGQFSTPPMLPPKKKK